MTAFGTPTLVSTMCAPGMKITTCTVAGTGSYDTGGSVVDLSTSSTTGLGLEAGFTQVDGVEVIRMGAAAQFVHKAMYLAGASAALGKIMLRDLTAASDAEATAAANLSTSTFTLVVYGR